MMIQLFKPFIYFFANLKIKQKLLLTYFVLIIIPLYILTHVTYIKVSEIVQSQTLISAGQLQDQADTTLEDKIDKVKYVMDVISLDGKINEILRRDMNSYSVPDQLRDFNDLSNMLTNLRSKSDDYSIKLYVRDGLIYSEDGANLFSMDSVKNSTWYHLLNSSDSGILWCPPSYLPKNENCFSAVRIIWNHVSLTEKAGLLRIDIPTNKIQSLLKKANITKTGIVFIQSKDDILISSSDGPNDRMWLPDSKTFGSIKNDTWTLETFSSKKVFIRYKSLGPTGWKLVSVIPLKEVLSSSNQLRNMMILLMLVVGSLAYLLAFFIANASIKKISQLLRKMKKVQTGDLNVIISNYNKDEIGELAENFNYMIHKINDLYEEQFKSGQAVKAAELKALQAQINPHFLYNSLDLINCIALNHKIPDISLMVQSLTRFYKLSLNKGRDLVSIKDEIEHVKVYTQIQNLRFENRISLGFDIPEELYHYQIIKIILQPLVENAILHGIFEKGYENGNIKISGFLDNSGTVVMRVQDDGVGMYEEKIQNIFKQDDSEQLHGYGVKNINDRIKLFFGEKYGLSYQSEPGKGTTVEVRFPAVKWES